MIFDILLLEYYHNRIFRPGWSLFPVSQSLEQAGAVRPQLLGPLPRGPGSPLGGSGHGVHKVGRHLDLSRVNRRLVEIGPVGEGQQGFIVKVAWMVWVGLPSLLKQRYTMFWVPSG